MGNATAWSATSYRPPLHILKMGIADRMIDLLLLVILVASGGALCYVVGPLILHIVCGLIFMAAGVYTLIKAQAAQRRSIKLAWFFCTGAVLFLFSYWALQVVFRPPRVKVRLRRTGIDDHADRSRVSIVVDCQTTMGCGGVR